MALHIQVDIARIADFCKRWKVSELSVFGSVLKDDFRADSDIDVMITFAPDAHVGLFAFSRMQRELSEIVGRDVDLVTREGLKPRIKDVVLSEAETLYAA